MPTPRVEGRAQDIQDPHTPTEILGRGEAQRKSKTFLRDTQIANVLGHISGHPELLARLLRELHAHHYDEVVEIETDDGETERIQRPEVLDDEQLRDQYPVIRMWERLHQEQVAHSASVEGFSVQQAVSSREERERKEEPESSAEVPQKNNGQQANARWR